jgi:hypothetical protein
MGTRRCGSVRIGYDDECKDRPGRYPLAVEAAFLPKSRREDLRDGGRKQRASWSSCTDGGRGYVNRNDDGRE